MKEIGLISNYYAFMSPSQRYFVQKLALDARNYRDFVSKLVDAVCGEETRADLLPFALRYSWALGDLKCISMLASEFGENTTALPWYIHYLHYTGQISDSDIAIEKMQETLQNMHSEWILFEGRILLTFIMAEAKKHEIFSILQGLEGQIRQNPDYEPLRGLIEYGKGYVYYAMEELDKGKEHFLQSVQLAERFGDLFAKAVSLNMLSLSTTGTRESLEYLSRSKNAFNEIGNLLFEGVMQNNIGFNKVALARYDEAIQHYSRAIEIDKQVGNITYNPFLNIAVLYGNLGQDDKALEYAEKALRIGNEKRPDHPAPKLEMARALILSGRTDDAYEYLESGGELAFRAGSSKELCRYYLVRGMLEMARDDYASAVSTLKRGLRMAENTREIYYILQILLQLAGAEITVFASQDEGRLISSTSTALARLEQLSQEQEFSGLSAQVKLLKAEIDVLREEEELARTRLEEALEICDAEGMLSLRSKVEARLTELGEKQTRKSLIQRFKDMIRQITIPSGQQKETPFKVMGCILILQSSGLEVYSRYIDPKIISDPSLIAGLISAVSNFAREIRQDTTGNLQSIVHQDIAVLLEHGTHATCALLADRDTYDARVLERRFLERFEETYSDSLKRFENGVVEPVDATPMFQSIVMQRELDD